MGGAKTRISVNGRAVDAMVQPGTFARVQRTWKSGDRVELEMDMPLRLETIPYQQAGGERVALMYGPVALFAIGDLSLRSPSRSCWRRSVSQRAALTGK